jgi:hypothetical protein
MEGSWRRAGRPVSSPGVVARAAKEPGVREAPPVLDAEGIGSMILRSTSWASGPDRRQRPAGHFGEMPTSLG